MKARNLASWPSLHESVNTMKSHKPAGMERRPSRRYTRARSKRAASPAGIRQPPRKERGEWCQLFPPTPNHTHPAPTASQAPQGSPAPPAVVQRPCNAGPAAEGNRGGGGGGGLELHTRSSQRGSAGAPASRPPQSAPPPAPGLAPGAPQEGGASAPLRPGSRSLSAPVPLSSSPVPDGGKAAQQTHSNGHARRSLGLVVHRRPARPGPRAPSAAGAAQPSTAPRDTSEGAGPRTPSGMPPSTARPAPLRAWTPPLHQPPGQPLYGGT